MAAWHRDVSDDSVHILFRYAYEQRQHETPDSTLHLKSCDSTAYLKHGVRCERIDQENSTVYTGLAYRCVLLIPSTKYSEAERQYSAYKTQTRLPPKRLGRLK